MREEARHAAQWWCLLSIQGALDSIAYVKAMAGGEGGFNLVCGKKARDNTDQTSLGWTLSRLNESSWDSGKQLEAQIPWLLVYVCL